MVHLCPYLSLRIGTPMMGGSVGGRARLEEVLGVGGVFFRATDPKALADWYRENLGVPVEEGQTYGVLTAQGSDPQTVWATFPLDTDYFGPGEGQFMLNFRVRDLDAMLMQLRAAGVEVLADTHDDDNGRFAWGVDLEGNRFELWEPK